MEPQINKQILSEALHYVELGFSVIPVGQDKKPLISWRKYQKERASKEQVEQWFVQFPNANAGIVTGAISGVVVVDIEAGGKTENLPPTVISQTGGGGWHFFYKHPGKPVKNAVRILDKTDVRGDGGFVILPSSLHQSGKRYEWRVSPDDADFAELPHWVLEKTASGKKQKIDWQTFLEAENPDGVRNMTATQLAGKILYHLPPELWEISGWATLKEWNNSQNKPPMEESELRQTWESIKARETKEKIQEIEKIDTSQFKPLSSRELIEILGLTIKQDEENKLITFLCQLSAYTENDQLNISFNAPSSTGKSYIPTEIAKLFPKEDVIEIGYCSPTAFFHDRAQEYKKETNELVVDLSRKILIFLDQPHTLLLQHLRPLLSHDKKEIKLKITDKSQRGGLRTKNILLRGFPAVIFCTAGLRIDEQEATRFLLLSPEVNQGKIRQGISEIIRKEADNDSYRSWLEEKPERKLLKERIKAIKSENIKEIKIANQEKIEEGFLSKNKVLKPRHQRDIKRLISFIKSSALLNLWWRERNGSTITANKEDMEGAFKIWDAISVSQELNLPPYIYNLYQEVILVAWQEKNGSRNEEFVEAGLFGLSRQELLQKHFEVYGRMLDTNQLRQQILPMLEIAGLIIQEADPSDKRKMLIYPTALFTISQEPRNSETRGG